MNKIFNYLGHAQHRTYIAYTTHAIRMKKHRNQIAKTRDIQKSKISELHVVQFIRRAPGARNNTIM